MLWLSVRGRIEGGGGMETCVRSDCTVKMEKSELLQQSLDEGGRAERKGGQYGLSGLKSSFLVDLLDVCVERGTELHRNFSLMLCSNPLALGFHGSRGKLLTVSLYSEDKLNFLIFSHCS